LKADMVRYRDTFKNNERRLLLQDIALKRLE
jgi:hypothetical protein